jgi:hypothetical protein
MHVPAAMKASLGIVVAASIAVLAGAAAEAQPNRAMYAVTLRATITKDWNTVSETTEGNCRVVRRAIGHRTVTLRSARPTRVVVNLGSRGASFSPSAVRFMTVRVKQSGENKTRRDPPCPSGTELEKCRPAKRTLRGGSFHFFRSKRNEISFRPARLPDAGTLCPSEPAAVRTIRPGLRDAEGKISEVELARGASQTGFASAAVTTELESGETGSVTERVSWSLSFARR